MNALPRTFFKTDFVNPISLSQKPPNQGARLGINFHSTPVLAKVSVSEGEENKAFNSAAAERKVEPLSDNTRRGKDLLLLKRRKACRKHSTVRSVTISRCTARLTAQVNRQMYTLCSPPMPLTYRAPEKSIPVTSNGMDCCTRAFTSGGGSGAEYGLPANFLQVTHFLSEDLFLCLAHGTQYIWRRDVSVMLTPAWYCCLCMCQMRREVNGSFCGRRRGNLADSASGAFVFYHHNGSSQCDPHRVGAASPVAVLMHD